MNARWYDYADPIRLSTHGSAMTIDPADTSGRVAQRRRTRAAIVEATARLLRDGAEEPSIAEIAAAADVSRRTIYMYFPTLDQLLLDAMVGSMSTDIDQVLAEAGDADARVRVERMIDSICRSIGQSLPMGRKLIKLTVDRPPAGDAPKRGYRRIGWIEQAHRAAAGRARRAPLRTARLRAGRGRGVGGVHRAEGHAGAQRPAGPAGGPGRGHGADRRRPGRGRRRRSRP